MSSQVWIFWFRGSNSCGSSLQIVSAIEHFLAVQNLAENEATCEEKDDHTLASCEREGERDEMDTSLHSFMDDEASAHSNEVQCEITVALLDNPPENNGLVEGQTKLYSDKAVTQIEIPEAVMVSKDEICPIVKDICLDEGLYAHEKIVLENGEVNKLSFSSATNEEKGLNGQMVVGALSIMQDLIFTSVADKIIKVENSWTSFEDGDKPDISEPVKSDSSVPNMTLGELLSPEESDRDHSLLDRNNFVTSDQREWIDQKNEQTKTEECSTIAALSYDAPEPEKNSGEDKIPSNGPSEILGRDCPPTTGLISDSTISSHSGTENIHPDGGLELIEPVSGATALTEERGSTDSQIPFLVQDQPISEMTVSEAAIAPARNSFYQSSHVDPDLMFSGAGTSAGHIAYSGSISMRSDSSTTSTRSFAFPILQREWNASPVKMAKARKPRWKMGLICCKF